MRKKMDVATIHGWVIPTAQDIAKVKATKTATEALVAFMEGEIVRMSSLITGDKTNFTEDEQEYFDGLSTRCAKSKRDCGDMKRWLEREAARAWIVLQEETVQWLRTYPYHPEAKAKVRALRDAIPQSVWAKIQADFDSFKGQAMKECTP